MTVRMSCGVLGILAIAAFGAACKSNPVAEEPPTATNLITITSAGVNPKNIVIARGSQVTFTNNDSRVHEMQSDPHPSHDDCPEIGAVGFLLPGQTRSSSNLNIARTCGFHDNQNEGIASLRGTIVIQ